MPLILNPTLLMSLIQDLSVTLSIKPEGDNFSSISLRTLVQISLIAHPFHCDSLPSGLRSLALAPPTYTYLLLRTHSGLHTTYTVLTSGFNGFPLQSE